MLKVALTATLVDCSITKNLFFFYSIENFFLSDPEMKDKVPFSYLSHKEKYEEAIRKSVLVFKKIKQLQEQGRGGVDIYM